MSKPSSTNYPSGFLASIFISFPQNVKPYRVRRIISRDIRTASQRRRGRQGSGTQGVAFSLWERVLLGGYSSEVPPLPIPNREVKVPPLPIPNREVKLTNADGTAVFPWESR